MGMLNKGIYLAVLAWLFSFNLSAQDQQKNVYSESALIKQQDPFVDRTDKGDKMWIIVAVKK